MEPLQNNTPVWVIAGYMDCQCHIFGHKGVIVARVGERYLVKNQQGAVETCAMREVMARTAK